MARGERVPVLMSRAELQELDSWMDRQRPPVRSRGQAVREAIREMVNPAPISAVPPPPTGMDLADPAAVQPATPPPDGWPWDKPAPVQPKQTNFRFPHRLREQWDWLLRQKKAAAGRQITGDKIAESLIRPYVEGEMRKRGIPPL